MAQTIRFGFCWLGSSVQYYYSYYSNHRFLQKYLLHPASVNHARDKIIIKIWRKTCFFDSIFSWIKSNREIVEANTNCWSCDSNWENDSTFRSSKGQNWNEMNNYLNVKTVKRISRKARSNILTYMITIDKTYDDRSSYTIIWYFFVLLTKNATEQLKSDFGFSYEFHSSIQYPSAFTILYCVLVLMAQWYMVLYKRIFYVATPDLLGSIKLRVIMEPSMKFLSKEIRMAHRTQHTAYTMIYETLSVVGTPYLFANQCQHWRYSLFICIRIGEGCVKNSYCALLFVIQFIRKKNC